MARGGAAAAVGLEARAGAEEEVAGAEEEVAGAEVRAVQVPVRAAVGDRGPTQVGEVLAVPARERVRGREYRQAAAAALPVRRRPGIQGAR